MSEDGTTHSTCEGFPQYIPYVSKGQLHSGIPCGDDRDGCQDVAYSLNHAHALRTEGVNEISILREKPGCYDDGPCGEGKPPK